MTGPERDNDIDAWLQTRRSLLRNADDALTLEPPPELDQRVIDRARRELARAREEKPGFFRGSRFTMPFAIAATVVLSFSLVLEINRYEGGRDALRERAENSAATPITLTAAPVAQPAAAPTAPAAAPAAMAAEAAAMADRAVADAAPARRARDKADLRSAAPAMQGSMTAAASPMPAAPPPPMLAMEQPAPASINAEAIASASMSASVRNAAPAAASGAAMEARRAEPVASARAAVAAKSTAADTAVDTAADNVATAAPARPRSAAQWWKRVQQLRDAGRSSEAEVELKALRQAYPDFVVPAAQAQPQQ